MSTMPEPVAFPYAPQKRRNRIVREYEASLEPDHPDCPGWALFEAEGSSQNENGDCPYQVQRWDEMGKFNDDANAWRDCWERAAAGERRSRWVLRFIRRFCKPEWALITKEVGSEVLP